MSQFLSRSKVRIFESALEKLGRILAEKYKIKIIFKHDACMTDGRTIYLPVIPENASQEFLDALQGFLDHEVAHLLFSDFNALKRLERKDRKKWNITQSLEDARIEAEMRKLWRGAGVNLNRCNEWALQQLKESWDKLSDFGKFTQGIAVLGCDGEDHWFVDEVLKAKEPEIWQKLEKVMPLIIEARTLPDSGSVITQSQRIMDKLGEEEEDLPEDDEQEGEPGSGPGGGEEYGEDEEEGEWEDSGEGEQPGNSNEPGGNSNEPGGNSPGEEMLNVSDEEMKKDEQLSSRHNMVRQVCKRDLAQEDRYLIYTTEGDKIVKIEDGDKVEFQQFLREGRASINVLLRKMRLNLLSEAQNKWESGKRRGKINPKAVFRVPIGTSKRVFRQRITSPGFDTAVMLATDHSGSMAGYKVNLAAKVNILVGECLQELGIPFEILGYSTSDFHTGERRYSKASHEEKEVFTRWGDMWIGVYKSFDEDWRHVRHRCINMDRHTKANTFDGESIRYAAARLLQRPEKRKILFVMNDGCPCPNVGRYIDDHSRYCKEMAAEIGKVVELFAVGICSRQVKDFYENSVSIDNVEELPKVMVTQLDEMLRKGKTLTGRKVA